MAESLNSDFKMVEKLGSGTFGDVYKVIYLKDNLTYALKIINLEENNFELADVLKEIQFLKDVNHQNIVKFSKAFRLLTGDKKGITLGIQTELCELGDLDKFIAKRNGRKFSSKTVQKWMMELTSAVGYLHSKSIIHRDLKPGNVFLDKYTNIKIGDFGISKSVLHSYAGTQIGTTVFMAPETYSGCYYLEADIYSLGCVFLCMVTAETLPVTPQGGYRHLPAKIQYGKRKNDIIRSCLHKDRSKRPTASHIFRELSNDDYSTLSISHVRGVNVSMTHNPFSVYREDETKEGGFLFSNRPLKQDEKFCLKIKKVASTNPSVFEFGFTTADPTISPEPLNHDVFFTEQSFVFKEGKKIAFWFTKEGFFVYEYGGDTTTLERKGNINQQLWAFFKLDKELQAVKLTDYD